MNLERSAMSRLLQDIVNNSINAESFRIELPDALMVGLQHYRSVEVSRREDFRDIGKNALRTAIENMVDSVKDVDKLSPEQRTVRSFPCSSHSPVY